MIHPTAIVDPKAEVDASCSIGPYCCIEANVVLHRGVQLDSHVVLKSGVRLQEGVKVHAHAILGDVPQIAHQTFDFPSYVEVGAHSILREGVTIHRASRPEGTTYIGHDTLLMAFSHVGHDTLVGHHCIFANQALLAGEVTVQDYVFISGGAMVHQFVHIGESAFISGNAEVGMHVPPFVTVLQRNCVSNLNVVGLQRRNFHSEVVADIKHIYRFMYDGFSLSFLKKAQQALDEHRYKTPAGHQFLSFFLQPKPHRGFVYPRKHEA